jgi:hypothetical protein
MRYEMSIVRVLCCNYVLVLLGLYTKCIRSRYIVGIAPSAVVQGIGWVGSAFARCQDSIGISHLHTGKVT